MNTNDVVSVLNKIKFWQLTFVVAIVLLILGFTGSSELFDLKLLDGKEDTAIYGGFAVLAVSVLLRYVPPPRRRASDWAKPDEPPR